jgi:hypothetical protein
MNMVYRTTKTGHQYKVGSYDPDWGNFAKLNWTRPTDELVPCNGTIRAKVKNEIEGSCECCVYAISSIRYECSKCESTTTPAGFPVDLQSFVEDELNKRLEYE